MSVVVLSGFPTKAMRRAKELLVQCLHGWA